MHAGLPHPRPGARLAIEGQRTPHRVAVIRFGKVCKNNARGRAVVEGGEIGVDHGVGQTAHGAHQRQAAVEQAVHLGEAAGLESGRHEGDIAAGKNAVGKGFVVANAQGHAARMTLCRMAEGRFQFVVAATQDQQLPAAFNQGVDGGEYEVEALLLGQAADHGEQGRVFAESQTGFFLQGGFAARLARETFGAVVSRNVGVGRGIPHGRIDRVENAAEVVAPGAQQPIEAEALFGRLDFARIAGADRGDLVGVKQTGLHERDLAMKFQTIDLKRGGRQAEIAHHVCRKNALVGQVVHGIDTWHRLARAEFQAGCRQAGMPVVAVHEVRRPGGVKAAREPRCRPAQRGETPMIVGVGTALRVFVGIARAVV